MKRAIALALFVAACGRSPAEPSASPNDAGPQTTVPVDAALPPCVMNPRTYLEIINACTDAEAVDKAVDLSSMSLPDGGLHPLP